MTSSRRGFLAGVGAAFAARGPDIEAVDAYGGWTQHDLGANGRFRITRWRGGRWLVTPDGHPFVALGVASPATGGQIRGAGFNCLLHGAAEVREDAIPHTVELNLTTGYGERGLPRFPDLHDPAWRREAAGKISQTVPPAFEDVYSIGYALSGPLLISPTMKSANWMTEIKSAPATAASKQAYIEFLRGHYGTFVNYTEKRGALEPAQSFEGLLPLNLAEGYDEMELDADDALFYQQMWSDATEFLVSEIRRHDPDGIIYSFRYAGRAWPDPWVESFLKGVGPHVDALLPEFSPSDPYRQMVTDIGRLTQKPVLAANGMAPEMFAVLVTRPWFLGGAAGRIPESEDQVALYRELSARKYTKRLEALELPL